MLVFRKKNYWVLCLFVLVSCTKKPKLDGLDLEKWKEDRGACTGERTKMIAKINSLREELKGVSSNDIPDYLGKPDIQQLADRSQKYYIYFLEAGAHCTDIRNTGKEKTLALRFSAMGLATEVTIQKGVPTL